MKQWWLERRSPASWSPLASGQTGPEREGRTTICLHFLHKPRKPSSPHYILDPLSAPSTLLVHFYTALCTQEEDTRVWQRNRLLVRVPAPGTRIPSPVSEGPVSLPPIAPVPGWAGWVEWSVQVEHCYALPHIGRSYTRSAAHVSARGAKWGRCRSEVDITCYVVPSIWGILIFLLEDITFHVITAFNVTITQISKQLYTMHLPWPSCPSNIVCITSLADKSTGAAARVGQKDSKVQILLNISFNEMRNHSTTVDVDEEADYWNGDSSGVRCGGSARNE